MADSVIVEAPSRIHFGMFAFGAGHRRQFGGVGLMVDEPRLRLVVRPAGKLLCRGLHAERVRRIVIEVAAKWLRDRLPLCEVEVLAAPREHAGLGLGTQLTLAVASGLIRFADPRKNIAAGEIAVALGRAKRSSVGTYGFMRGGLIVDAGHAPGEPLGLLVSQINLPESWRIVLATPPAADGLSGIHEGDAFTSLPPVPLEKTRELAAEVLLEMIPAAGAEDFNAFAQSVFRFGQMAGSCFSDVQGGPFSRHAAPVVEAIRELGASGVGQSSWGPTVFAFARDASSARSLAAQLFAGPGCVCGNGLPNWHQLVQPLPKHPAATNFLLGRSNIIEL